jgi:hypothetical protein
METGESLSFLLWWLHNAACPKESAVTMATWQSTLAEVGGGPASLSGSHQRYSSSALTSRAFAAVTKPLHAQLKAFIFHDFFSMTFKNREDLFFEPHFLIFNCQLSFISGSHAAGGSVHVETDSVQG